jgi:tripartite-type tricarboxylate transporter receptor subunit TctC
MITQEGGVLGASGGPLDVAKRAACSLLAIAALPALAQNADYPARPIRFIAANAPGGGLDITARAIQPRLSASLGQQVIVDNRAGAAGSIASEIVAKAAPDGYTIMVGSIGGLAVNTHLYKGLTYHPLRDLAAITWATSGSNVLVVHPSVQAKSVKELISLAKAQPDKLSYGSSGAGNAGHLAGELFNGMAGVKMVHIPYKGGAPAMIALLAGQIELIFSSAPTAVPQVKAGKIRALAVTTSRRSVILPELPTVAEAGLPGFEADNWYGVVTTMKTPRAVIDRLNAEIGRALHAPDVKQLLLSQGLEVRTSTPQEFAAYIRSEFDKWAKVIKDAGIVAN